MKRNLFFILVVCILTISCTFATEVSVKINGRIISFDDVNPQIINNRTMVPFRKIFNELGVTNDNISWYGDTKTIVAKKDDIEITLQIGNNIAEKKISGTSSRITLDSEPVIQNGRTLVPLRFIAESLGKIVDWDSVNKIAIINDYGSTAVSTSINDYYLNAINAKSTSLYNFINTKSNNLNVTITRNYTDKENSRNNNNATVNANIQETQNGNVINQLVSVNFSGTNGLMKDIADEGWANIKYENNYYDTYFTTKALTNGWKKVYGQEQLKFMYTGLGCKGKPTDTISTLFSNIGNGNDSAKRDEFDSLLKLFSSNSNGSLTTGNISSESISMNYFDLTTLDNIMYDSAISRVWSFLNSQVFNYDITWEELRYDYPTMNMTVNANNLELTIDFILSNTYNEKVEYIIKINK